LADSASTTRRPRSVGVSSSAVGLAVLGAADRGGTEVVLDWAVMVLGPRGGRRPPQALDLLDCAVEVPMVGTGHSLDVAVAGCLVLYRLAGLL
jgi:tRNA (guanosine-2'-O-)-methyltransferase